MILCVGIGNTNIKCAAGMPGSYAQAEVITEDMCCGSHFMDFIAGQFGASIWDDLRGCIISSVVPQKKQIVSEALRKQGQPVQHISLAECGGVDFSGYKSKLGEDRAVCCAEAAAKHGAPLIIIDFGTATTVNIIDGGRAFLGGLIMPGVQTGLDALSKKTAQLPLVDSFSGARLIGGDTRGCIVSGAVFGAACMLESYIRRVGLQLDIAPPVIITGGGAPEVLPFLSFDFTHTPSLLIDGLFSLCKI